MEKKTKNEILSEIRTILGTKRLNISEDWFEIGKDHVRCIGVTRKYIYLKTEILAKYSYDAELDEKVIEIRNAQNYSHSMSDVYFTDKVELDKLSTDDLLKLSGNIKFYLWRQVKIKLANLRRMCDNLKVDEEMYNRIKVRTS
jgi:hypothetical protein